MIMLSVSPSQCVLLVLVARKNRFRGSQAAVGCQLSLAAVVLLLVVIKNSDGGRQVQLNELGFYTFICIK